MKLQTNILNKNFNQNDTRFSEISAYALSMLGQNLLFGLMASALVYYYQSVIFLPTIAIGLLNVITQSINIAKDPIMGLLLDKTQTKIGKCRPYLIIMPIVIGAATVAAFINEIYSNTNSLCENAMILTVAARTIYFGIFYIPLVIYPCRCSPLL